MLTVNPGLAGVVAFDTEIAEPDRDGGALRYRGVDIRSLAGAVSFGDVYGLLADGSFDSPLTAGGPGLPAPTAATAAGGPGPSAPSGGPGKVAVGGAGPSAPAGGPRVSPATGGPGMSAPTGVAAAASGGIPLRTGDVRVDVQAAAAALAPRARGRRR